jgi:hypothetical protein
MSAKIDLPPRICEECGETFTRRMKPSIEKPAKFKIRKYCGGICRNRAAGRKNEHKMTSEPPPRVCQYEKCGKNFTRKPNESKTNFKVRRFCDREHQYAQQSLDYRKKKPYLQARIRKRKEWEEKKRKYKAEQERLKRKRKREEEQVNRDPDRTVFGERRTGLIWRPESLGGPYYPSEPPRQTVRLSDLPRRGD